VSVPRTGVLRLTGVRAHGRHGVLPEERRDGQDFVVDARLRIEWPAADALEATVDYAALARRIEAHITGEPWQLIESLAQAIAEDLANSPRVRQVRVRVHKPGAPLGVECADVAAECTRGKPAAGGGDTPIRSDR